MNSSPNGHDARGIGLQRFQEKLASGAYAARVVERCQCGAKDFVILDDKDRNGLDFASLLCLRCGLVHSSPRLDETALPGFYAGEYYPITYGTWTAAHSESLSTTNYRPYQGYEIHARCAQRLPSGPLRVMEIGCGCGLNLYQFARAARLDGVACRTVGVDYSPAHRRMAKDIHGVDEVFASIDEVPAGRAADVLVLSHVLEHFSDLDMWLRKIACHVSENGIVYVEVPGLEALPENPGYLFSLRGYFHFAHIYCFTLHSLRRLLSLYGFELLHGDESVHAVFRKNKALPSMEPDPEAARSVLRCARTLAASPYPELGQALAAGREGRIAEGLELAEKALASHPDMPWTHAALADLLARKGDARQAADHALRAVRLGHPQPLAMLSLRIDLLARMKDTGGALAACADYEAAAPAWDNSATIRLARLERQRGDANAALERIRRIEDRAVAEPQAVHEEALCLIDLGRTDEAAGLLRPVEERFPGNLEIAGTHVRLLLKSGLIDEALQAAMEIISSASQRDKWTLNKCALSLLEHKLHDAALQCVEAALQLDPDFPGPLRLKGGILAAMRRCDEAVAHFRDILRQNPKDVGILLNIADAYRYDGRLRECEEAIDELGRIAPDHPGLTPARVKLRNAAGMDIDA